MRRLGDTQKRRWGLQLALFCVGLGWNGLAGADEPSAQGPAAAVGKEAAGGDKRAPGPIVRTYSSVTVVSDPAQVPRLPAPARPTSDAVRALRGDIQEMRRDLRADPSGARDGVRGTGRSGDAQGDRGGVRRDDGRGRAVGERGEAGAMRDLRQEAKQQARDGVRDGRRDAARDSGRDVAPARDASREAPAKDRAEHGDHGDRARVGHP